MTTLTPEQQAIIYNVTEKLIEQGPSWNSDTGRCMYRSPSGAKCAVGLLIPDAMYKRGMDDEDGVFTSVNSIVSFYPELLRLSAFQILGLDILTRMQDAHDSACTAMLPPVLDSPERPVVEYTQTLPRPTFEVALVRNLKQHGLLPHYWTPKTKENA